MIHVPDVHADPDYTFSEAQRLSGDPRTFLGVPLLREGKPVGALVLLRRSVRPFTDKQIELVTTFADQAVIAIENVRLFDEVEQRTKELAASLDELRTAQDLRDRRLLLQRHGEVAVAGLQFLEQADVLDGDDGLIGEGLHKRDLPASEWPVLGAGAC